MKIAIGKAYNGLHKTFKKEFTNLGVDSFFFDIDNYEWFKVEEKKPDAYLWRADNKEERYVEIYNRVYFIENIFNKPVFPDMKIYFMCGDKIKEYQFFKSLNLNIPKTFITNQKEKALNFIEKTKYPFIFKDPYGYGGYHVFKINNKDEAKKCINKIFSTGLKTNHSLCKNIFYAQEFIKTEKDLRVITIGNKAVFAYWRISDDWKHNITQGAHVCNKNIPKKALKLCESISQKFNLHWMAYDLFVLPDGQIKFIELNCNIGTFGPKKYGVDIHKLQAEYIINYLNKVKQN